MTFSSGPQRKDRPCFWERGRFVTSRRRWTILGALTVAAMEITPAAGGAATAAAPETDNGDVSGGPWVFVGAAATGAAALLGLGWQSVRRRRG